MWSHNDVIDIIEIHKKNYTFLQAQWIFISSNVVILVLSNENKQINPPVTSDSIFIGEFLA